MHNVPPDFEVLDARIASALNRIIHKDQKEDRFLRGRQIAFLIYEYFGVTGANDSVESNADLFTVVLRNDDIQEFDSKWDGILLLMTKIPPDDILEGLYKLRIRESDKLKTVLELYDLETHQKKVGPDYHRLKTMAIIHVMAKKNNSPSKTSSFSLKAPAVVSSTMGFRMPITASALLWLLLLLRLLQLLYLRLQADLAFCLSLSLRFLLFLSLFV